MTTDMLYVKDHIAEDFQTAEAIKTIRTNLFFCGASVKTVALTSVSPDEGKSSLSFQLAASIAQTGKKVLYLDADLRKSVMMNRLGLHTKVQGLSHYLSGLAKLDDILYKTDVPKLYLMFAGARIVNPTELLGSAEFEKLFVSLKDNLDYVIVDTPPLGRVIDTAVIAPKVDGVIMVIDSTRNSWRMEQKIKEQLEKAGARILGVILNKVDIRERSGYYGKYGYGYGYGYGNEKDRE